MEFGWWSSWGVITLIICIVGCGVLVSKKNKKWLRILNLL